MGLDPGAVTETVAAFNAAIRPGGTFDPGALDNCSTEGLEPAKSHWAVPIEVPPFYGYPLRPGITFTYLGLAVDERARVLGQDGAPIPGIFAAGVDAGGWSTGGYASGLATALVLGLTAAEEIAS